ncbi:MAG: M24 family metallopeptidase [Oscillibacter sp.]|nr:M24 family metallopeptidase [Oscillibacter sp.]
MEHIFSARRRRLAELLPDDSAALIFSGEEIPLGVDMVYPFSVDKNFYYLTGLDLPGAAVYLSERQQILLLPPFDPKREQYEGPQNGLVELCTHAGFLESDCRETGPIEQILRQLPGVSCLYLDLQRPRVPVLYPPSARAADIAQENGISVENIYRMIYSLRAIKGAEEITCIRRAVDITGKSLASMVKSCRSGMREYEWQAAFECGLRRQGCDTAFPSIVASGKNAVYLHYVRNDAIVQEGDLFLFDVGAYYDHYAADISRTYPVGGKFTRRQRELYDLVYDATRLVLEHMKPHCHYRDHVDALHNFFDHYLLPLHIVDTELEKEAFLHMMRRGCCHHLGLDAHDAYAELDDELLPGMVFTNEPGVYLKHEGIGIRIEEDLLITESSYELLSAEIPSAPEDVLNMFA